MVGLTRGLRVRIWQALEALSLQCAVAQKSGGPPSYHPPTRLFLTPVFSLFRQLTLASDNLNRAHPFCPSIFPHHSLPRHLRRIRNTNASSYDHSAL